MKYVVCLCDGSDNIIEYKASLIDKEEKANVKRKLKNANVRFIRLDKFGDKFTNHILFKVNELYEGYNPYESFGDGMVAWKNNSEETRLVGLELSKNEDFDDYNAFLEKAANIIGEKHGLKKKEQAN